MNTLITEQARKLASAEGLTIAERVELACVAVADTIELDHLKEWACADCVREVDEIIAEDSGSYGESWDYAYNLLEDCLGGNSIWVEFNPNGVYGMAFYAVPERYADEFNNYFS